MPTAGKAVIIAFETQNEYNAIQNKDGNAIYFVTDTGKIYIGNIELCSAMNASTKQYIDEAIGGITEFDTVVVNSLPQNGVKGTIYFVPHNHGESDTYDEYLWVSNSFEKIGNTDIDLSGYIPTVTGAAGKIPEFKADGTIQSSGIDSANAALKSDFQVMTQAAYDALETKTAFLYLIREE